MPYAVSFGQRVTVFANLISRDKQEHQGDRVNFMAGPSINVLIRRNFLYEDSFEKLSPENGRNLFTTNLAQIKSDGSVRFVDGEGETVQLRLVAQVIPLKLEPLHEIVHENQHPLLGQPPTDAHPRAESEG